MSPRRAWIAALAFLAASAAVSCGPPAPTCTSTAQCGAMQACIEGACVDVGCLAAADCEIEQTCSPESYTCEPGCLTSDDCRVGDRCDLTLPPSDDAPDGLGTCSPRACRDTQLDCPAGDRCDAATGRCEPDPLPYCDPCGSDAECGPTGVCAYVTSRGPPRCVLACSPEAFDPCPAGLQCSMQVNADGTPDGFRCVGLCTGF